MYLPVIGEKYNEKKQSNSCHNCSYDDANDSPDRKSASWKGRSLSGGRHEYLNLQGFKSLTAIAFNIILQLLTINTMSNYTP